MVHEIRLPNRLQFRVNVYWSPIALHDVITQKIAFWNNNMYDNDLNE